MRARALSAGFASLVAAALVVAAPPAPASPASAGGGLHPDGAEGTPLDLTGAALGQQSRNLVLTVHAATRIAPGQLSGAGGGELCATLTPAAGTGRRLCLTRTAGAWHLQSAGAEIPVSVGRPTAGRLAIRFAPGAAGLRPGPLRWRVSVRAATCAAGIGAGCVDRAPDSGSFPGRVWRPVITGCSVTGPAQVLSGPRAPRVALTYDDGPANDTPAFLDELERLGVPATFFMIGRQVAHLPAIARRALADGDAIGNHTWDHANVGGGGPAATDEILRTQAEIRRVTGFTPCLFRPPYRATGPDLVARVRAQAMTSVLWSVDPSDWATPGSDAIVSRVLTAARPGAIILEHDGGGNRSQTLAALPRIVAGLRARGYSFVTVPELLGFKERLTLER